MIQTGPSTDGLARELAALESVARALSQLEDADSRARVLHWAAERFDAARAATNPAERPDDPAVAVDGLAEFFECSDGTADDDGLDLMPPAAPTAQRRPEQPLESLVQSFAVDLRRVGQEWQRA